MARTLAARWDHDTQQIRLLREQIAELAASEARPPDRQPRRADRRINRIAFHEELALAWNASARR